MTDTTAAADALADALVALNDHVVGHRAGTCPDCAALAADLNAAVAAAVAALAAALQAPSTPS